MSTLNGKWTYLPLAELRSPEKVGPLWAYKDAWWVILPDDTTPLFARSQAPQCNTNRLIVDRVMLHHHPEARAVFLPWAYLRFNISDYAS